MGRSSDARFRVTAWPGITLPPVSFWAPGGVQFSSGTAFIDGLRTVKHSQLPEEFYLRQLQDVDLDDEGSLQAFVSQWGFVFGLGPLKKERSSRESQPAWVTGLRDHDWLPTVRVGHIRGSATDARAIEAARASIRQCLADGSIPADAWVETLFESRLGLAFLRDLTKLWRNYQLDELETLPTDWESGPLGIPKPNSASEATEVLVAGMNYALGSVSARLQLVDPSGEPSEPQEVSLYSAAAIQLYNHIAEDAKYRKCAAEGCGRLFVRHLGRSKYPGQPGSRTGGVLYCSSACSHAQSQREFRRRKKLTNPAKIVSRKDGK